MAMREKGDGAGNAFVILADELVSYVGGMAEERLTADPFDLARKFEYAALVRAVRLVSGMAELQRRCFADVSQVLLRPVLEGWLIGSFLALSPSEGLRVL